MKQRFIVILVNPTVPQQDTVTLFLKTNGYGYWHWSTDTWLITSLLDEDVQKLREKIRAALMSPQLQIVVVGIPRSEAKMTEWALLGPPNWGEWFRSEWE